MSAPRTPQLIRVDGSRRRFLVIVLACASGICALVSAAGAGGVATDEGWPILDAPPEMNAVVDGPVGAFARSADGCLVVGSNCLSVYDGVRWETVPTPPGAYAFRGLAAARDRVWVGGVGALGYIARNPAGRWDFFSLTDAVRAAGVSPLRDVWHVQATDTGALFVGTDRVLRWDGTAITAWPLPGRHRLQAFPAGEELWLYQTGVGMLRMSAAGPLLQFPESELPEPPPVVACAPLPGGDQLMIFPESAYRLSGHAWEKLDALSETLRGRLAIGAAVAAGDAVAIGTFNGGVVLAHSDGRVAAVLDGAHGLADDNVTAVAGDQGGDVWIGLGSGEVVRLTGIGAASRYPRDAEMNVGAIRKVVLHDEVPHVLTSRGIYALADGRLSPRVRGPQLLWDAASVDGRLWAAGFGGIWEVAGDEMRSTHETSADVLMLAHPSRPQGGLLFVENYTVKSWRHGARGWVPRVVAPPVEDTPLSLVEDGRGVWWVSTIGGRLYGFEWEADDVRLRASALRPAATRGATTLARPRLFTVAGRVVVFTNGPVYALTRGGGTLEPIETMKEFTGVALAVDPRAGPDEPSYWIVRSRALGQDAPCALLRVQAMGETYAWEALDAPGLDGIGPVVSATLAPDGPARGSILWIAGANGVLRLETDRLTVAATPPAVALRADLPASTGAETRMRFSFPASPAFASDTVCRYETKLAGVDATWSTPQALPSREFPALAPGVYTFSARAVDRFGRPGPATEASISIPTPWWRRAPALGVAMGALLIATAGVLRWRVRRLQLQNDRLNGLVAERTRELSLSNTAKSEFIENISHEIRNPLQGMVSLVQLLEEEDLEGRPRELARSLSACARTLQRVFDDVLSFSKLEYGYVSVVPVRFVLEQTLDDIRDLFLSQALRQGNSLSVQLPPGDWRDGFEGDEGKIRTIISNFVSNALKYAPGTPVSVSVSLLEEQGMHAEVVIEVTDGGAGVPTDEQELIFKKFVRGERAKATQAVGAGIGLAACRALAKLLGGNVGVESRVGRGATFFLRLPLRRAGDVPVSRQADAGLAAALVVDDQAYNRIALAGTVEKLGFAVECASDAAQAIAAARQRVFSLVLLDLEMPGAKGPETAARLRALPGGAESVILGVSAHDSHEAAERCLAAGMDAFLVKPVSREQLRGAFADVVAGRAAPHRESIDFAALELYAKHAPGGLVEARLTYVRILEQEVAALHAAARRADPDDVRMVAHRVRSHASIIGASRLGAAAAALENAARAGRVPSEGEGLVGVSLAAAAVVAEVFSERSDTRAAGGG